MAITTEVTAFQPGSGVRRADADGVFVAEGDDPQMLWVPTRAQEVPLLGRTAVTVRLTLRPLENRLFEPCIYVDWGDGFSDAVWKPLSLVEGGIYVGTAHSNAGACRRIRFDPSTGPCRFQILALSIEAAGAFSPAMRRIGPLWRVGRRLLRRLSPTMQHRLRAARAVVTGAATTSANVQLRSGAAASERWRAAYDQAFDVARGVRSVHFAAPPLEPPARDPEAARIIAFYLPQYHPILENDAWWGPGFTEWANVTKATPQFTGHQQPKLPADLGYYDLRTPQTLHAQIDLARRVGVDAFCFHYYWFAGRRLLEGPLDAFVADPAIHLPFCLCWANENWTRRWDGDEHDVLIGQRHSPEDDMAVIDDLARYMRSPRYLRVDGRPLLVVYRPDVLPDATATLARWRARARETGLGELFVTCTNAFGFADYRGHGFDAVTDFPPHAIATGEITDLTERLNPAFRGRVYDYSAVVDGRVDELATRADPRQFPGVMPSWDNEARKPGAGHVFHEADPPTFLRWMTAALACTQRLAPPAERLVFVNAWNEWAEGAYLEPDRWFGHGFGQAVRSALEATAPRLPAAHPALAPRPPARPRAAAGLVHIYYRDLVAPMAQALGPLGERVEFRVSFPDTWGEPDLQALRAAFPSAWLAPTPNRGRDVAPFFDALRWAKASGYELFCKLHAKRSPHRPDGAAWRERILEALASPVATDAAFAAFAADPQLGLLASAAERTQLGDAAVMYNNRTQLARIARLAGFSYDDATPFASGTMFWGRTAAFDGLLDLAPELAFEPELGRIDGGLAHALERAMGALVMHAGYSMKWLDRS